MLLTPVFPPFARMHVILSSFHFGLIDLATPINQNQMLRPYIVEVCGWFGKRRKHLFRKCVSYSISHFGTEYSSPPSEFSPLAWKLVLIGSFPSCT